MAVQRDMMFDPHGDYKSQLSAEISKLQRDIPPLSERVQRVDELIETYFSQIGEMPNRYQIEDLSNILLADELKNRKKNKRKAVEYNFHSEQQKIRDKRGEQVITDTERTHSVQKVNESVPTRRHRSIVEQVEMDMERHKRDGQI